MASLVILISTVASAEIIRTECSQSTLTDLSRSLNDGDIRSGMEYKSAAQNLVKQPGTKCNTVLDTEKYYWTNAFHTEEFELEGEMERFKITVSTDQINRIKLVFISK